MTDIYEILKDCRKGTRLYSPIYGDVTLDGTDKVDRHICVILSDGNFEWFGPHGEYYTVRYTSAECMLFPSRDERDWRAWRKRSERFDPETLMPFDRVLVRDYPDSEWKIDLFSHIVCEHVDSDIDVFPFETIYSRWRYAIPYNDDTKHLVGIVDEAPEHYRFWEK